MQLNAGLLALALAGFATTTLTVAHPHKHHLNVRHAVKHHGVYVPKAVGHYGRPYPSPSPKGHGGGAAPKGLRRSVSADGAAAPVPVLARGRLARKDAGGSSGVDRDFPDGEIDCSHFPAEYGALAVAWATKDGWSGIQKNGGNDDHVGVCTNGALCSYACPAGYSKAQWPAAQPASGESYGGLECRAGKLYRTRKDYPKLCQAGKGTAQVHNKLSQLVAICRTDYPGSENMVVPLSCSAGSVQTLTVPDAANSYVWRGGPSSAQYYVNNAGVGLEDGCVWGQPNGGKGNWSPVVVGAGYRNGKTWLSISQNSLNSDSLNFNIRIVAGDGASVSAECKYENGKFSGGDTTGCTVAVEGGSAIFELYD